MNTRTEWCMSGNLTQNAFYTKDETVSDVIENFNIRRYCSAEGCEVAVNIVDTTFEQVIIQNHSNPINKDKVDKKVLIPMESIINTGTYITYRNELWMVCSQINVVDDAYKSCMIQKCNWLFKWQNTLGETITRQSVVLNASQYNSGVEGNKTLMLGSNQFAVYLPLEDETLQLTYEMRVFIDNAYKIPYKITRVDNVSTSYNGHGLVILIMSQDQLNLEKDRVDLGLCNYITSLLNPIQTFNVTYLGDCVIRSGGINKTFTATSDKTVTWSVDLSSIQNGKIVLTNIGNNQCKVKCLNDEKLIGTTFKLVATDTDNNESYVTVSIIGGV